MNSYFFYDGQVYELEHTHYVGYPERVVVWAANKQLVGDVAIDHTLQTAVNDNSVTDKKTDVSYFEFTAKAAIEIAEWIVANSINMRDINGKV